MIWVFSLLSYCNYWYVYMRLRYFAAMLLSVKNVEVYRWTPFVCGVGRLDVIHLCHKMRLTFIRKGYTSTNHVVKLFHETVYYESSFHETV